MNGIGVSFFLCLSINAGPGLHVCSFFRSSSPDSLTNERGDSKTPASSQVSPSGLYKLVVPLMRCEAADVRDAAVQALGKVNVDALK